MKLPSRFSLKKFPVGMRTLKTALAVTLSLMAVEYYGASPAKVVFATIGAISAVGPTFTASLLACMTQICGVTVGALLALVFLALPIPPIVGVGIGIMVIITSYHHLKLKLVPVLPCLVLVNACLNPEIQALSYSLARIWDTAIGLAIGMLVNTLIFPYDNSKKIRQMMAGLDEDLICILEDLFDGDDHLPQADSLEKKIDALESQLALFSQQRLLRRKRQKREIQRLSTCEDTAQALRVELAALCAMPAVGRLNRENRQALLALGAKVSREEPGGTETEEDVVSNYHVSQVLRLRQKLKGQLAGRRR